MATTRIMPLHTGKGRSFGRAISDTIDYVSNPEKTEHGKLITSFGCDSRSADAEFALAKQEYIRKTGRVRGSDDVIAYHLRQAFRPGEITPEEANRIGVEFAKRFTKEQNAFIVCTHTDKAHIHNHIIWSAVNITCDRKFRNFWGSTKAVRQLSDTLCIENGYSIVENPRQHGDSYNKWLGDRAKPTHRDLLRQAIDRALAEKPDSLEALWLLLSADGFQKKQRGGTISFGCADWKKFLRLDRLGEEYTEAALLAVLSGKASHTPRQKPGFEKSAHSVNLLVDIQAKLQQGKGAGYERWAKVFNLKQMAQTMNYLTEHNLLSYSKLKEQAEAAAEQYHEISGRIQSAEKRMTEISKLEKQIIAYLKTKEVYAAYRKTGYSKKFYAEHEAEILLQKAARQTFDELGYGKEKKLPTLQNLREEYAQLLSQKKNAYRKYRSARETMKAMQNAKYNVDTILNLEIINREKNGQALNDPNNR